MPDSDSSDDFQIFIRPPGQMDTRLRELENELRNLPGRDVLLELEALDSSARVFGENFYELRRFLEACEGDPRNGDRLGGIDLLDYVVVRPGQNRIARRNGVVAGRRFAQIEVVRRQGHRLASV